jgi:hypothetical protein
MNIRITQGLLFETAPVERERDVASGIEGRLQAAYTSRTGTPETYARDA